MENRFNEFLLQQKLQRISEAEDKLTRYSETYEMIRQSPFAKYTKNAGSNFFIWFVRAIQTLLFAGAIVSVCAGLAPIALGLAALALLFSLFVHQLRRNKFKRNIIYNLSAQLEEMISYMEGVAKDERRRYEDFIDRIHEENLKDKNETQST